MLLESKSKFDIHSPNRDRPFSPDQFLLWSDRNMYRTSYNDMKSPTCAENKNHAIPKYAGYVPGMKANNEFGATYATISRRAFSRQNLDNKPNLYASTGFNWKKLPKQDDTLSAWSYKYGAQTMQKPHPAINDQKWTTTARQSFQKPMLLSKPNLRHSSSCQQLLQIDGTMKVAQRPKTFASGFQNNAKVGDGKGWVPEKLLHSDMRRTEYRMRFNCEKPFQKTTLRFSHAILPRKTLVYDKE